MASVCSIDYQHLHEQGIRYIVFDKDNTLTAPYSKEYFSDKVRLAVLDTCVHQFGPESLAVISNSAGCRNYDPEWKEAAKCEHSLQLKFIRHDKKKPAVMPDILFHFNITRAEQVCIVGDRVTTDIVMGNQHGCYTVLVEPLAPSKDNFVVRLVRRFEDKWLIKILPSEAPTH